MDTVVYSETRPAPLRVLRRAVPETMGWKAVLVFVVFHVLLGTAFVQSEALAALHAMAALGAGLWLAVTRDPKWAAYAAAYIAGGEVLWRMAESPLPWEFGKYALSLVLLTSLIRWRQIKGPLLPLLYIAFLLPSAWLTFMSTTPNEGRQLVSFNLSGPFALFTAAWFFSHLKVTGGELRRMCAAFVGPIAGVLAFAVYVMYQMLTSGLLEFHTESNPATSGGFGPNQVSSMLGLGALMCIFFLVSGRIEKQHKLIFVALMLLFALQSFLTFSRSGMVLLAASCSVAAFYLIRDARSRAYVITAILGSVLLFTFVVMPRLNDFTGDAFIKRFTSTSTSHRGEVMLGEIDLWKESPIFGIGPGMGTLHREEETGIRMAAHTEFTRVLAEHGLFGLFALVFFLSACAYNIFRGRGNRERAVAAACIAWALLFMVVNAFRLAAPAFAIGITFSTFLLNDYWHARVRLKYSTSKTAASR